jgi:nucleotidyltransferase/DNA polymerase involved in DNA repair
MSWAVGHLDADCFYVSAERVRDPFLKGKPVGVLGNQGACVIAKSYEMKAAGVKTGEPIWDAVQKCPDGIYIKRDFRWYEALSRAMLEVMNRLSPQVEYYSIDEFFFQARPRPGQSFQDLAVEMRDTILRELDLPVTVGIARSRTLAKLISDSAKPFGARAVLQKEHEEHLLAGLPVTEISGVARRRGRRLLPWGIASCLDLARADRALVRKLLTATGEALWWELNGQPAAPINAQRPRHKALSRGGSLGESTDCPQRLHAWLVRNLERLIEELHYHRLMPGRLVLWVGYRDGTAGEAQTRLAVPTDRFDLLLEALRPCLQQAWRPGQLASRMHLIADDLADRNTAQTSLFTPPDPRQESLAMVKKKVNDRIGRFALRSAATLPLREIYHDNANGYDICDVRGKTCF